MIFGLYRGFVSSVLSMGSCLISLILSFVLSPKLVAWIQGNQDLTRQLLLLTDASSRVGDQTLALTNVNGLTEDAMGRILTNVSLPYPLDKLLEGNLAGRVFAPSGMNTVSDYVSQTIIGASIRIISFLICFLLCFIAVSILINLIKCVFRFPVLKQMDKLVGAVFGLLRGAVFCFLLFALLPLIQTMVPLDLINEQVAQSSLAPLFSNGSVILAVIRGKL